jgi:hypothetical protein
MFETTADMLESMRKVAHGCGMSVRQFCRLVAETVVRDGLVDAVLDPPTRAPVDPRRLGGRPRSTRTNDADTRV